MSQMRGLNSTNPRDLRGLVLRIAGEATATSTGQVWKFSCLISVYLPALLDSGDRLDVLRASASPTYDQQCNPCCLL